MKRLSIFGILVASLLLLSACSSPSGGGNNEGDWSYISNRNDLIGTWEYELLPENNVYHTYAKNTLVFESANYGYLIKEENWQNATAEYKAQVSNSDRIKEYFEEQGYTSVSVTSTSFYAKHSFTGEDIRQLLQIMQINTEKTKLRLTMDGLTAVYTKKESM